MQHAADLLVTPDDRIEFSRASLLVEVDGILAQRVELLLGGLRIDRRTLAEGADRLDQLLFRRAAAFEDVGGLPALGHEGQQQVFDGGVFVAEILREVHGALDRLRGVLRKELLAAALDARQRRHGPADLVAQRTYSDAHASQQERRKRIVLADQRREQVERFDSLLSLLPRQRERRLQRLLRLDSKSVDVHSNANLLFLFFILSIPFPNAVIAASRRVYILGPLRRPPRREPRRIATGISTELSPIQIFNAHKRRNRPVDTRRKLPFF